MRLQQRIRREQGRHADDWLITYADTITLLLCLFVIILSMKAGGKILSPAAPDTRAATVEDIFWGHAVGPLPMPIGEPGPEVASPPVIDAAEPAREAPPSVPAMPPAILVSVPLGRAAPAAPEAVRSSLPAVVDRLRAQGTAVVAHLGDRITTLQIGSTAFFGSGSAELSGAGTAILSDVAGTLKSDAFAGYRIAVEGHTDDTPISTPRFQSNWELSTARAAAVVRFFLDQGISARKLTAAGYADTFPLVPNRNADGTVIPENQAKNRRVVIRLEKIDKADQ